LKRQQYLKKVLESSSSSDAFDEGGKAFSSAMDLYKQYMEYKNNQFSSLADNDLKQMIDNIESNLKRSRSLLLEAVTKTEGQRQAKANNISMIDRFWPQLTKEKQFVQQKRFIKIFGNHDLYWANDPTAWIQLQSIYGEKVPIYEGCVLTTTLNDRPFQIYLTHGHQGDLQSDGNAFSKFFVSNIWGPMQGLLDINPNTPAFNNQLKSLHNSLMYEWSSVEKNVLLITGHTHQPVFMSLTHLERLYVKLADAQKNKFDAAVKSIEEEIVKAQPANPTPPDLSKIVPSYFNSGCCCFADGDITGIEIAEGYIRLIKWKTKNNAPGREVLEEIKLAELEDLLP